VSHHNPDAKQRLLSAARTEFARHARAGARTDRIAQAARVNKQLIHYYFRTKAGLYEAVLKDAGEEVASALATLPLAGLTAVERLRRLVRTQFDYLAQHPELTRLLVQAEGGAWFDQAVRPMAALLTEGQATGFFRDDIDPLHHARQALLLHLGYFVLDPLTRTWGDRGVWRDRSAELIVRGSSW
jgi:TetR/AcrR family transcriptional regulator